MVMEATHSAQNVGREFVRQYYTLLNQAPAHLHRFYNHNSLFIHGGLNNADRDILPAIGQKEIHQKIQQLKFRDCHTRISQVDAQATLDDGVVIQVTGEFSNAGAPMRRFTQTFVLASRAPKMYYVLNDIFRYQDLGFPEDEEELETENVLGETVERTETEEGRSEPEEDDQAHQNQSVPDQAHSAHITGQQPPLQQPQQPIYYPPTSQQVHPMQPVINGSIHEETPLINQQRQPIVPQQTPQSQQQFMDPAQPEQFTQEPEVSTKVDPQQQQPQQQQQTPQQQQSPQQQQQQPPPPQASSTQPTQPQPQQQQQQPPLQPIQQQPPATTAATAVTTQPPQPPQPQTQPPQSQLPQQSPPQAQPQPQQSSPQQSATPQQQQPTSEEENRVAEETSEQQPQESSQQPTTETETEQISAAGANSRAKSYARTVRSSGVAGNCPLIPKTPMSPPPVTNIRNDERSSIDMWNSPNTNMNSNALSSGPQHRIGSNQTPQQRSRVGPMQKDNRGRRDWPDIHQLFVGNVPHHATESELRVVFERFGKVVDLRIFTKGNERGKGPTGQTNPMKVPHYGFVTFEDANVVAKVLAACPICYPGDAGQKLNIEEKKNKPRVPGDNNMRSNQDNMRSPMGVQQHQQQQRGPGGPGVMRGGGQHTRGSRGFSRDGGRGTMRQPGNMGGPGYQNRR